MVGAVVVKGLLDNIQLVSNPWQQEQSRVDDSKIIFKMEEMQQIVGKLNANIFQYRGGRILK